MLESTTSESLDKVQRISLIVGVLMLAAVVGGGVLDREQAHASYLVGYLFWFGIALGSLGLLMLHHLTGGGWGFMIRRFLEAAISTLPLMFLLFVPILIGMHDLYIWTHEEVVANDPVLQHKAAYLNTTFFQIRAIVYFLIWCGGAYLYSRWSYEQDRTSDASLTERMRVLAGPGIILYILTMTFASVDWVMSLDPHWFSTIHGLIFVMGQIISAMSLAILCAVALGDRPPLSEHLTFSRLRDLGTLLFAFVMLWAYFCFSQYLIIWSANLPEETTFFVPRMKGTWGILAVLVLVFHFALPFSMLLSRHLKAQRKVMVTIALTVLVMRFVDLYWYIAPSLAGGHGEGPATEIAFHPHWMDVAAPLGIGGIWLWLFIGQLKRAPLMPLHDPRMTEALADSGHGH